MIQHLGLFEADLADPEQGGDEQMELPDGAIISLRDIRRALGGQDYTYYLSKKAIAVPGCPPDIWQYYLQVFDNCEAFGLPSGKGWRNEPSWLLDFLIYMRHKKSEVERWQMSRAGKNDRILGSVNFGEGENDG